MPPVTPLSRPGHRAESAVWAVCSSAMATIFAANSPSRQPTRYRRPARTRRCLAAGAVREAPLAVASFGSGLLSRLRTGRLALAAGQGSARMLWRQVVRPPALADCDREQREPAGPAHAQRGGPRRGGQPGFLPAAGDRRPRARGRRRRPRAAEGAGRVRPGAGHRRAGPAVARGWRADRPAPRWSWGSCCPPGRRPMPATPS